MTHDELHTLIRTTIARLELCSSARTQAWDTSGGKGSEHPGGKRPPGANTGADRWFRDRLTDLDAGRPRRVPRKLGDVVKVRDSYEHLLGDARVELAALTGRTDKAPEPRGSMLDTTKGVEEVIKEDGPGKPADEIAQRLGVSKFIVRKVYMAEGLDPHDGSRIDGNSESEQQRLARQYWAEGKTQKQIGTLLGVSQPTVSRYLGKRAA